MLKYIKKYWFLSAILLAMVIISLNDWSNSEEILLVSWNNVLTMLSFVPPIFILIGLLDVFVSKEQMIKYMGEKSGLMGYVYAGLLGGLAAGPLYMAFPISAILLKKHANIRYIVFFLGIWSSMKLPILIYEFANFGFVFTMTNIVAAIVIFILGSYIVEQLLSKKDIENITKSSISMLDSK
ncbi:MAG: permease [Tenericutes bacterium]|nr:permease [Mycoplasmatota bacterium]